MSLVTFLYPNMSLAANSHLLCRVVRCFNFYNRCVISALSSSPCSPVALWSLCRSSLQIPESLFPEVLLASPQCVSLAPLAIAQIGEHRAGSFSSTQPAMPRASHAPFSNSESPWSVRLPCVHGTRLWKGRVAVEENCWGAGGGQVPTWVSQSPPWAPSLAPWSWGPSSWNRRRGSGASRQLSQPVWGVVVLSWQRQALLSDEVALASQTGVLL